MPTEPILTIAELQARTSREPNYQLEADALRALVEVLAESPSRVLQCLNEMALQLCACDSVGITLAGEIHSFRQLQKPIYEVLLVPFKYEEKVAGSIWAVSHRPEKQFDKEDLRLLTSLSHFASAAILAANKQAALDSADQAMLDAVEQIPDAFFSVNKSWHITRVNKQFEKLMQVSRTDIIGQDFLEFFLHSGISKQSKYWHEFHRVMNDRVPVEFEEYYAPLKMWTQCWAYPTSDGFSVFFSDTTEQKRIAFELANERKQLESIISKAPAGIAVFRGPTHIFENINDDWVDLVGKREYIGKSYVEAYPELANTDLPKILDDVFQTGIPFVAEAYETLMETTPGFFEKRYYDFSYIRIDDSLGQPYGLFCHALNVTDRVVNERKVTESESRLNLALTTGNIGFWDWNAKTGKVFLSESLMNDWGIDPETFGGTLPECMNRIHSDDRENVWDRIQSSTDHEQSYNVEYRVIRPSGEEIWVNAKGQYFTDANGEPERLIGITLNITESKRSAALLAAAKLEAERANELKSAFLANMSHEIRTPLGAMLGFAGLLRDPNLSAEARANYVDILSRNGEGLSVIINDILDLSKVEAGHMTLEMTDTFPEQIAADVVSLMRVKAKDKDLLFEYYVDPSTPNSIVSDPTRVRQMLLNVVSNAIKFTSRGSVLVRCYGLQSPSGKNGLKFTVTDTGIGISETQKQSVFNVFEQADGTMTRRFGGTGLGLTLSRRLARSLGGDIVIENSEIGKGSTFVITVADLPERRNSAPLEARSMYQHVEDPAENALDGMRVLIVDDSPDNQQLICHYLKKHGAILDSAEDGYKGYRKALLGNFDAILMDIQMPEMDGYTATQKLRDSGFRKPIIALTAHAMTEVQEKCLNVGYSSYVAKPINYKELIRSLVKYSPASGYTSNHH